MASGKGKCVLVGPFYMDPDEEADCCVACHIAWEEQYVLPYLPIEHQEWILAEHAHMRAIRKRDGKWPIQLLIDHAETEDLLFARYLPPPILARMDREHKVLEYKIHNGLPLDD